MWLMVRSKMGEAFSCIEKTFVSALAAFVSADRGRRLETTPGERTGRKASACQASSAKPNAARRPCRRFSCEKETSPSKTPASPLIKPGKRPMKSPLPPYVLPKPLICFPAGTGSQNSAMGKTTPARNRTSRRTDSRFAQRRPWQPDGSRRADGATSRPC